ncbi:MAG: hypothetical protein AAF490_23275 [Chloroflexota bacterium]
MSQSSYMKVFGFLGGIILFLMIIINSSSPATLHARSAEMKRATAVPTDSVQSGDTGGGNTIHTFKIRPTNRAQTFSPVINVRSGPGDEFTAINTLQGETQALGRNEYDSGFDCVEEIDEDGNLIPAAVAHNQQAWVLVEATPGVEGWVNLCQVQFTNPGSDSDLFLDVYDPACAVTHANDAQIMPEGDYEIPEDVLVTNVNSFTARLWESPGGCSTALARLPFDPNNVVFDIELLGIHPTGDWLKVRCRGVTGWVLESDIQFDARHDGLPVVEQ